jgi:ubiquinol-cytochrome c reductase cytochrome b subunit
LKTPPRAAARRALGVLAVVRAPGIGPTPVQGIEVTKPLWMFLWYFSLEDWFGVSAILWAVVVLVAVPFLDRGPERHWRKRPLMMAGMVLVVGTMVVLTVLVLLGSGTEHVG